METKYDGEINNIKEKLKEIEVRNQTNYQEEESLNAKLKILRNKQLLESGLLSGHKWYYDPNYQIRNKNCVTLVAQTHYWRDLEEATGESSYHWNHTIIKGEIKASGDDGKIALHINKDKLEYWIKKLGLVIDEELIKTTTTEYLTEIQQKYDIVNILDKLKTINEK